MIYPKQMLLHFKALEIYTTIKRRHKVWIINKCDIFHWICKFITLDLLEKKEEGED